MSKPWTCLFLLLIFVLLAGLVSVPAQVVNRRNPDGTYAPYDLSFNNEDESIPPVKSTPAERGLYLYNKPNQPAEKDASTADPGPEGSPPGSTDLPLDGGISRPGNNASRLTWEQIRQLESEANRRKAKDLSAALKEAIHEVTLSTAPTLPLYKLFNESDYYRPVEMVNRTVSGVVSPVAPTTMPNNRLPTVKTVTLNTSDNGLAKNNGTSQTATEAVSEDVSIYKTNRLSAGEQFYLDIEARRKAAEAETDENIRRRVYANIDRDVEIFERRQRKIEIDEKGTTLFTLPRGLTLALQKQEELGVWQGDVREKWCCLFDGMTFFGWRPQTEGPYAGGRFRIANETIISDKYHPGLLYTTCQFGDSVISMEYQTEPDAEAFLLLRTSPSPRNINASCYAIVLNSRDPGQPPGTILGRSKNTEASGENISTSLGWSKNYQTWQKIETRFNNSRLEIVINENPTPFLYVESPPLGYGYVGLLVTRGEAKFCNILWRPGSSQALLDASPTEMSWTAKPPVELSTVSHSMQVNGGPGVIESKQEFDNFILQVDYTMKLIQRRSGIFFRCSPGLEQSGYLVAIQDAPTRQERDSLFGVDVGSFQGRKEARFIRPAEGQTHTLTLVAVDRHFQTWVDAVPVCEWSDKREKTNGSAKDGALLRKGPLQIWAPNAETYIQFKRIQITPIHPRNEQIIFEKRG